MSVRINPSASLILLLLTIQFAAGQPAVLNLADEHGHYTPGKLLWYVEDKNSNLEEALILSGAYDEKFAQSTKDVLNFGVTTSTIWLKLRLQNLSPDTEPEWILTLRNALMDNFVLYSQNRGNGWSRIEAGDEFDFDQRKIKDHDFSFYLSLPDTMVRTYYMRCRSSGSLQIPLEIRTKSDYQGAVQLSELLYGLFTGALIIMFIYNLFVFFSLRDFSYLAYSLFIITNLALHNAYSGHNFQYLLGNYPNIASLSIPLLMALIPTTVALFSLSFLTPSKIIGPVRWTLYGVCVISGLLIVSVFFLPIRTATSLAGILIIITLVAAIVAGVEGWVHGNRGARYYVIAWLLLIASGLVTAFRNFGFLENNFATLHGGRIATIIEMALLSLSLADRYNRFRKEKEAAQKELIEMQRQANKELEQKVKDRTKELSETNVKLNVTLDKVEEERAKSEALLLNVLPKEIMKELKETGRIVPRNYPLATVLFSDIKNFTSFAGKLEPDEVIKSLNECFLAFDDICRKYGLEKIKTLGDGYMAVGGLPVPNKTNPVDAVRAGLAMQQWIAKRNKENGQDLERAWEIRIGINSGPVVAGIIGKHKFVYDIWGDTVNMASRMESAGTVGKVNISHNTYGQVKDFFICNYQGKVTAKNKGEVDLYHALEANPTDV